MILFFNGFIPALAVLPLFVSFGFLLLFCWQVYCENASALGVVYCFYSAFVFFYNFFAYFQAESGSGSFSVCRKERLEDRLGMFREKTRAGVLKLDGDLIGGTGNCTIQRSIALNRIGGVFYEVAEDLEEVVASELFVDYLQIVNDCDIYAGAFWVHGFYGFGDDFLYGCKLQRRTHSSRELE